MIKKLCILPFFILIGLVISCENPVYDLLTRTTDDPFVDIPHTDSFITEKTVYVNWREDKGADTYVLMRAVDDGQKIFKQIYRGKGLSYIDTDLQTSQRYVYRLDKIRGRKYFKNNAYAYGVYTDLIKDAYEDNDTVEKATYLEYACLANIYCYHFTDDRYLEDIDWYRVRIPARRQAQIVINEVGVGTNQPVSFYILNPGVQSDIKPIQNTAFGIKNTTERTVDISFKVYPDRTKFSGSTVKSYEIRLESIINL